MSADPLDTIAITECKAHFLRLADEVARTGRTLVVTRHGRPLIRIEAAAPPARGSLRGSVTQLVGNEALMAPSEDWADNAWSDAAP